MDRVTTSAGAPALIVAATRPGPGQVEPGLAAALGEERAARLGEAFLRDTLAHAARVPRTRLLVAYAPREAEGWFAGLEPGAELVEPPGTDLDERLAHAIDHASVTGSRAVGMIGADTPHVGTAAWQAALDRIAPGRVVMMPAADGGCAFLGLATPEPRLFEGVEWRGPRVLAQIRERAEDIGFEVELLAPTFTVRDAAGIERLRALLEAGEGDCPETLAALREP